MISASFIPSPSSGDVYSTDFTFVDTTTSVNTIVRRIWNFGDDTKNYNTVNPVHSYDYPGTYTITLTAFDIVGNASIASSTVNVDYIYRDCISFTQLPEDYSIPGNPTTTPFKISLTSAQINTPIIVNLYAAGSQSTPYETVPEKWRFLTPTWKFLDKNLTITTSLSVNVDNIYKDNKVVAVSGEAEFYYVDDKCSGSISDFDLKCPLLITATLQTSGFSYPKDSKIYSYSGYANNTTVRTGVIWNVYNVIPTHLKITGNYLEDIYPYKWSGIKIPFLTTIHSNKKSYLQGTEEIESGILFTLPQTNALGNITPLTVFLSNTNEFVVDEAPLYFQSTDKNGFDTGGYIFTTLTPTSATNTTVVVASTVIFLDQESNIDQFAYPLGSSPNVFAWVSNPENKTIHKVFLPPYPDDCKTINDFKEADTLIDGYIKTVNVPGISSTSTYNYYMSGFAGIYGMAIDPRLNELIATDAELDRIYKYSNFGSLLSTIELSSFGGYSSVTGGYTPSNICLDRDYNIYVSLFNTVSVLKFDQYFNFLGSLTPSQNTFNIFDGDFVYKPSMVETDRESNVWVTYSNPNSSILIKYDGVTKLPLITIPMPYTSPVSLAITVDNNIWVANSYNTTPSQGVIQLYSSTGTLISSVSGITHPSYLSIDKYDNLWFVYGNRKIGYISKNYNLANTSLSGYFQWPVYGWQLNEDTFVPCATSAFVNSNIITFGDCYVAEMRDENFEQSIGELDDSSQGAGLLSTPYEDEELGGLAVDVFNRLWVLDSLTNKVYTVSVDQVSNTVIGSSERIVKIYPDSLLGFYQNPSGTFTYTVTGDFYKSLQANGDWTGNKWYQKYFNPTALTAIPVSGVSTLFEINDFVNSSQIRLINENFDTANYYKSLALPEVLSRNTTFFDDFLGAVVGNGQLSATEDLGQTVYERIANFIFTHGDIDTCDVRQLLSYAQETGTGAFNYGTDFPSEIQKYLDVAATPRTRLYGLKSPVPILSLSIGSQLYSNSTVTAGDKVILQNKADGREYTLVTLPVLSGIVAYPLTFLNIQGFVQPIIENYLVFTFNPVYSDKFIENYIDWENPLTTLSPYISSEQDLYGDKGIIENTFNYLLTKNIIVK